MLDQFVEDRYSSFKDGIGLEIVEGKADLKSLEQYALGLGEIKNQSGRQERLRAIVNAYLLDVLR